MNKAELNLQLNEEVVFEAEGAVLTNKRIITNWGNRRGVKAPPEVNLTDVSSFQKFSGGQESRHIFSLQVLVIGAVALFATMLPLVRDFRKAETVFFVVGMLCIVVALYFAVQSWFRVRPHTTVIFTVPDGDDLPVYFVGKENPAADQLTRHFARLKRGV